MTTTATTAAALPDVVVQWRRQATATSSLPPGLNLVVATIACRRVAHRMIIRAPSFWWSIFCGGYERGTKEYDLLGKDVRTSSVLSGWGNRAPTPGGGSLAAIAR